MTTEVWADNATGTLSSPASSGASSLSVSTLTGVFPSPTTGQAFHAVIDFGTTSAEIITVGTNSSGAFTLLSPTTLAHSHLVGAPVACVVTAAGLNSLASALVGAGVPATGLGIDGNYYLRTDGSGALTHLYFRSGGTWTGLV